MAGMMGQFGEIWNKMMNWMPYDVKVEDGEVIVIVPLPGYEQKDVKVSVKGNELLIRTIKETEDTEGESEPREYSRSYLWERPIDMKIPFNQDIDPTTVKARLEKGLLRVRFQKEEPTDVEVDGE